MSDQVTVEQPVDADSVDTNRIEALLEDLNKSLQTADPSVEIISKGADAIVAQNKEFVEAVEKSISAMTEKLDLLVEKVAQLDALSDRVEKGFDELASQPLAPRAVTAEAELSPADVQPAEAPVTKGEVLAKALSALSTTDDPSRVAQIRKGIAQLESNYNPADVASALSL